MEETLHHLGRLKPFKKKKWDVYHVSTGAGFLNLQNSMWVEYGETTAVNQWDVQTFPGQKCEIH